VDRLATLQQLPRVRIEQEFAELQPHNPPPPPPPPPRRLARAERGQANREETFLQFLWIFLTTLSHSQRILQQSTMTDVKPPSGRTIVLELQREMESRLYPLMYRTLPPSVYHVYLHPDDYAQVHPVQAAIIADAQQALNTRVDEINRRSRWTRLMLEKRAPIEVPAGGWEIYLHPETNGELAAGELGIESRLVLPVARRFEGGTATTVIARTTVTGTLRKTTSETREAQPAEAPVRLKAAPTPDARPPATSTPARADVSRTGDVIPDTVTAQQSGSGASVATPSARIAHLTYADEAGTHAYAMRKDLISIGRGGSAHWVDVQVVGSTRVSREHCRIRRTADGRFFLQDVSTWGTSVDGRRIEPFVRQQDGRLEEVGHEHLLASPTRIQLADAVIIEFSLEPSQAPALPKPALSQPALSQPALSQPASPKPASQQTASDHTASEPLL
jgi:pSer/pThr/pTyr-binding forkhead associated (FHA) protein